MTGIRKIPFFTLIFLLLASTVPVQTEDREFLMAYDKGLLTLSVKNVDLREVLTAVSDETGIAVKSPRNLERIVTVEFRGIPLERGLRRILRGVNYALIYASSDEKGREEIISRVFVLSEQPRRHTGSRRASTHYTISRTDEERKALILERYERRLDSLEQRMATVDSDSPQGKAVRSQIRLLEKRIEKLL